METLEWRWRKSSYSGSNGGACVEVGAAWRKSSYSGSNGGNCVQIARNLHSAVAVRDSKNPDGPVLTFSRDEWATFVTRVRANDLADAEPGDTRGDSEYLLRSPANARRLLESLAEARRGEREEHALIG